MEELEAVVFDLSARYERVKTHMRLARPLLVIACMISFFSSASLWVVSLTNGAGIAYSFAILLLGVALFLLFVLVYAWTSLPFEPPPRTVTDLLDPTSQQQAARNVADAAEYFFIRTAGPVLERYTNDEVIQLLEAVLKDHDAERVLERLEIDKEDLMRTVKDVVLPELDMRKLAYTTLSQASVRSRSYLSAIDFMGVFLLHPELHNFLRRHDLRENDVHVVLWHQSAIKDSRAMNARWWLPENMLSFTGIGMSWTSGYTTFLDRFSRIPAGNVWDVPYGHEDQVEQLIRGLARERQANVLLIGQPGVGRLGIVKEVARRVHTNQAHPTLNGQHLLYINLGQLASLGSTGAQQLSTIALALREMESAGNVIAVLDGLSGIMGAGSTLNATDVLVPFFSSQSVRVVAVLSTDDYHSNVKNNATLLEYFEVVQVPPLDGEQTLGLLNITVDQLERHSQVKVPFRTLRTVVEGTESILPYVPFPEKAFDLLEDAIVSVRSQGRTNVTREDINEIIAQKVGVKLGAIQFDEQQHLLDLEAIVHKRVVNQEKGVAAVVRAMIRARAGARNSRKPIGTFLFLGPTGVGKTETAKALAHAYFGSEETIQRIDMSEFHGEEGIARLIGGAGFRGRLADIIADHPFAVLLLDEFEKADYLVRQLFLPIFDEGYMTDATGRRYSLSHMIIIATSNAGAEFIRTHVSAEGNVPEDFDEKLKEHILSQGIFAPEVLNRFDGVITFAPLSSKHVRVIAKLMLQKLNKQLDEKHGVEVTITDELLDFLVERGYNPEFGARPMARAIQDTVEYAIAEQIVRGDIVPGQSVLLRPRQLQG